jgi:hypothetical protein
VALKFSTRACGGKSFNAPVGGDTAFETNGFEYSALYVMAGEDNTKVIISKNGSSPTTTTLKMGESVHVLVNQAGDTVISDKNVEVELTFLQVAGVLPTSSAGIRSVPPKIGLTSTSHQWVILQAKPSW